MSVSLCMIVKNEERCIYRCLKSVSSIAEQMIIVDTGSNDKTIEIIKGFSNEFPNIDVKLLDFTWNNDFSAARNFSLSHATKDFILILDADEYFVPSDIPKIKTLLDKMKKSKQPYFINFEMINLNADVNGEKMILFPNHLNVLFSRPIHETPLDSTMNIPNAKFIKSNFPFYHDGYDSNFVDPIEKRKRNLKILNKAIQDDPNDNVSMYYFARDYFLIDPLKSVELLYRVQKHLEGFWLEECKYYIDLYTGYLTKSATSK